jgi:hypothetical protein
MKGLLFGGRNNCCVAVAIACRLIHPTLRPSRIFNTYGPRMAEDDGRVVSNFIVQALRNQDITLYGNGTQTRSFCRRP